MPMRLDLVMEKRFGKKEAVVANIFEFYIPKNFRNPRKGAPQQLGKVIEFCAQAKKSA